jgi:hypothetical protein
VRAPFGTSHSALTLSSTLLSLCCSISQVSEVVLFLFEKRGHSRTFNHPVWYHLSSSLPHVDEVLIYH